MAFEYPLFLDGGLATELKRSFGKDLSGKLWSAQCLQDDPEAIKAVHKRYFEAGANVATTASYQATIQGFLDAGYSYAQAVTLMRRSVQLAREARDEHGSGHVALSLGCYGAFLANGAEYTGDYGDRTREELVAFHRERLEILLQEPGVDFILFETIPSLLEAQAIRELIKSKTDLLQGLPVGVSFSCRSNECVSDGSLLKDCIAEFEDLHQVFAVGVNCTKPRYIAGLLGILAASPSTKGKALLLYPDGGEEWDAEARSWKTDTKVPVDVFGSLMAQWCRDSGKRMILGGCCGTGPAHIKSLIRSLS